ncbi:MAG TPA: BadF/BadG/BcrA/BcrD ATPase family protein [Patescibacteria group bacterium]|nr:BadF/BadG/BcrA/BcrD ATPase family protein [Patescibacteria group bacterium]
MELVLGVDGGNSKAIALVARRDGSIVGAARRPGSADIYTGEEAALELLRAVVLDALADAGSSVADVRAAAFSLAGADWPEDIAFLRSSLGRLGVGDEPVVVNDAIGALVGAVPDGPAVVVSLGTGAATGARAADGGTWHSSFWQVTQGAAELARRAVDGLARSELGIEPAPLMQEQILKAMDLPTVEATVHRLTHRLRASSESAGVVVRALFEAADAGDPVAERIVVQHGTGIGQVAAAAARRVGIDGEPYALAFCGGVVRAGASRLIAAAVDAIVATGQTPRLTAPRWEPAVGALLIGLRATSGVDHHAIASRLDGTMPPAGLFGAGE